MKFCAKDFSLDNALWSGRPAEVNSNQIKTLTENNQHYIMRETVDILKISKSIKLLVKMKNVYLQEKLWPCGPTKYNGGKEACYAAH